MGGLKNRFSGDDPYILSAQIATSNNNTATFNATVAENDHLRGHSVSISSQAIVRVPGTPFPQVATAIENTTSAALAGIGQGGTYSEEPGSGGIPCFTFETLIMLIDRQCPIGDINVKTDWALAFNADGKRIPAKITGKFIHLVEEYTLVTFSDGHTTSLIDDHLFWQQGTLFKPIRDINHVWHWNGHWKQVMITKREVIKDECLVYNLEVKGLQTYLANGDACHNRKPDPGEEPNGQ